jgi:hypothetical protein
MRSFFSNITDIALLLLLLEIKNEHALAQLSRKYRQSAETGIKGQV